VNHQSFAARVRDLLSAAPVGGELPAPAAPLNGSHAVQHNKRQCAQTHIVFGTRVFGHKDRRRYALVMLANAFGGGMSSRLFQKVREELGLAYSVYTYQSFHEAAGVTGVYVGTRHEWAERATDVIRQEYTRLVQHGLTATELDDIKGQVKGQIVIALESSNSRLHRLAGTALYGEEFLSIEEVMRRVDSVTLEDVKVLAEQFFQPDQQVVVRLGP
jgi:predicted Zn-dependent peptidase